MAKYDNDIVSPSTPRMGNALTRWIGEVILKIIGWKVKGKLPDEKKLIVLGVPHTSNWDLILAMSSMLSVGLKFSWMMKKEAFFWPMGPFWRSLGGIPIDRSRKTNKAEQISEWFSSNENVWLGITPEGTRSKVESFRKGYLKIAYAANVPVFIIGLHAPTKEITLDKVFELTGDIDADNEAIMNYVFSTYRGVNVENQVVLEP